MRARKLPQFDLKLRYQKAFELGMVGALLIVILFFQFLRGAGDYSLEVAVPDIKIEVEDVPPTEQIKRPPPPARPAVPIPTESEDIPEDETIEATDLDLTELPPPPPPENASLDEGSFVFVPYDEPPQMIGGLAALKKYLEYPEIARKAGIEAQVVVGVLVDEKGNTLKTQVLKGTGSKLGFEDAASKALMQMKWKPAYQRDKPVKVWISIPVRFKLQDTN